MDSNDIERERGITILSKNTAVRYKVIIHTRHNSSVLYCLLCMQFSLLCILM